MPTNNGEERPHRGRTGREIDQMMRTARDGIKIHNRYLDEIDNKHRGQPPGPALYAAEVEVINGFHREIAVLQRELDIRAEVRVAKDEQLATLPTSIANWMRQMRASASTPVGYTWIYRGNRILAVVQADGATEVWVQVQRSTTGAVKLGPTWVLPANNQAEYDRAMQLTGRAR